MTTKVAFTCLVLSLFLSSACRAWTSPRHDGLHVATRMRNLQSNLPGVPGRRGGLLSMNDSADSLSVPIILGTALVLGVAAQTFINQMIQGDRGLGAFLRDGSGYNRSGFRAATSRDRNENVKPDPLPWLKLPQLDFVEVAGQELPKAYNVKGMSNYDEEIFQRLETMRQQINEAKEVGRIDEAKELQQQLERSLEYYGIEFKIDN